MKTPSSIDAIDQNLSLELGFGAGLCFDSQQSQMEKPQLLLGSSLIQWAITQYTSTVNKIEISSDEKGNDASPLQIITKSHFGKVLALMNDDKIANLGRQEAEKFKSSYFNTQNEWPDLDVSESVALFCLDNRPGKGMDDVPEGLAQQLYDGDSVESLDSFVYLVNKISKAVAQTELLRGRILQNQLELGSILYELFRNTHDHARTDVEGKTLRSSIRGVYTEFYSADTLKKYFAAIKNNPRNYIEEYVEAFITHPVFDERLRVTRERDVSGFLELSVFDSGPGLATKWLGIDSTTVATGDQYDAVISCLAKGASTAGNNERGYGLWRVFEALKDLNGLIRLRTNNIHAVTQFRTKRHPSGASSRLSGREIPREVLYDWRRGTSTKQSDYPAVKGTLVSILLPVGEL